MNDYAWAGQITAPLAVAVGGLICFWGYRILKLTLGILGLLVGAAGGWAGALSLVPGHNGVALACAVVGGILGAILCVWLFYVGIFLLGASAGVVMAAARVCWGRTPSPTHLPVDLCDRIRASSAGVAEIHAHCVNGVQRLIPDLGRNVAPGHVAARSYAPVV